MYRSRVGLVVYSLVVSLVLALFASSATVSAAGSDGAVYTRPMRPLATLCWRGIAPLMAR